MKRLAIVLLAACGGSKPEPEPPASRAPARPAPAGFAECDLVSFDDGVLGTYAIRGEKLVKLGELRLAPPAPTQDPMGSEYAFPLIGDWADRDHLFVRVGKRRVVMVTAAGLADLAVPDDKTLEIPHPEDTHPSSEYLGKQYTFVDLVVEDGEVWWSRCPYSFLYDGGFCFQWVNHRLWPEPAREVDDGERIPRVYPWGEDPPKGYVLAPPKDPEICTPPTGSAVTIPLRIDIPEGTSGDEAEDYYSEHRFTARWVQASPPKLLVTYGYTPEFDPPYVSSAALFDGCSAKPSFIGGEPRRGPDGLWEASGHVFRGGTELGVVGDARFRPPN
ncbi:MAG: hypothetical protein JNL83_16500 [Myxococcales bacterium]|nr:hypothetical protein [Myxococcales bacterium]